MKYIKTIVVFILLFIVLGFFFRNPIKKTIYLHNYRGEIKKFLDEKYKYVDSVELSGDYGLNASLKMNTEFNSLGFIEQKPIIKEIRNGIEKICDQYVDKVSKIDLKISKNKYDGIIKFIINDGYYTISFYSNRIYKNGDDIVEYTEKNYYSEQIQQKISNASISSIDKDYINKYLDSINDTEIYKYLFEFEDTNVLPEEIAYQYLLKLYNNKDYSDNIFNYKNKLSNYKNSKELFNKISEFKKKKMKEYSEKMEEYDKIPRVGMTKEQVLETSWGTPKSKVEDKPNSVWRVDSDGEEAFFYVRGTTKIMVSFKNGKVDAFYITKKGDTTGTKTYSVEGY